jgi:AraC family transcriptional regulator
MKPDIRLLQEKKLLGKRMIMSFSDNITGDLWRGFMPRRTEIRNNIGTDLYSMQIYPPMFFSSFNPDAEFEKWAAIEVKDFDQVPDGMETFILKSGLYAVFLYRGAASAAEGTFRDILGIWLPGSVYCLDDRPHFEILGEKYKNESPDSEEELWIPIKPKEVSYSLAPWLTLRSSIKAVDFYKKAFNAIELYRLEGEGEDLVARLSVGSSEFWVSNGLSENKNIESSGEGNIRMILTAPDPDALFEQALKAGASQVFAVAEEHGWRSGRLEDPFGIHWEIGRPL